jgi:hypothetical protein
MMAKIYEHAHPAHANEYVYCAHPRLMCNEYAVLRGSMIILKVSSVSTCEELALLKQALAKAETRRAKHMRKGEKP